MYIDYKKTTWERIHISETDQKELTNDEIIKFVKQNQQNNTLLWDVVSEDLSVEQLVESDEFMTPEDNEGCSTIEIYNDDGTLLWENCNI